MLVTICTIRQLPQAFALGDSFARHAPTIDGQPEPFLIGLADDVAHLPASFESPFPLLPLADLMPAATLTTLSAAYTPTEFAAAAKPRFIAEVFKLYPDVSQLVYADPNLLFTYSLTAVWEPLANANALLTPHITTPPSDTVWPDEKFFQNVGLYSADFLVFRRSDETARLLTWWQDRVETRAYVDFCEGLCTDQLWLMHVPVFFPNVRIIKNPGWHVALWNIPERTLTADGADWRVSGPMGTNQPLVFMNAKGLFNVDEGFFPHQNSLRLTDRPDALALLHRYRQAVASHANLALTNVLPAYGQQPEPVVLRGWRRVTARSLRAVTRFVSQVPLPVMR